MLKLVCFEPLEFLEKLAALTPRPRINLILYHGVLAPHARWRSRIVPGPETPTLETDLIRRVIVPAALPGLIVALRLGFALALFVIVGAEFMGADAGLGHLIMERRTFFVPAQIVMGALVLGLLGSLVNALLFAAERRLFRWREAGAT